MGTGVLTWNGRERRSDRYGFVYLLNHGGNSLNDISTVVPLSVPVNLVGTECRLLARVIETRQSTHVGDLFRGVYPRVPQRGEVIVLGHGVLVTGENEVGLSPLDGREIDWLDIRALYDVHEQTVELFAEPVQIASGEGR